MEKQDRVRKEYNKIKRVFKNIDRDRKNISDSLMRRAAFMSITIEYLESDINSNGYISHYQNGENQFGTKKSPEIEIYNTMIKNYAAVIKQLCDNLPDRTEANEAKDDLLGYLKKGRK